MSAYDLSNELAQLEIYASIPWLSEYIAIIQHNVHGSFYAPVLTTCRAITEHLLEEAWRERDLSVKSSQIQQFLSHAQSKTILNDALRRYVKTVQQYGNPASHRSSSRWQAPEARVALVALLALLDWKFPGVTEQEPSPSSDLAEELDEKDPVATRLQALQSRARPLLLKLGAASRELAHTEEDRAIARERRGKLLRLIDFLQNRRHRIAFAGDMGVGKSSTIAILSRLFVGDRPTSDEEMRERSVLTVGSGGTTVCEICIRSTRSDDPGRLGLKLDPFSREELEQELRYFVEDEADRRARKQHTGGERATSREIQRALRTMTGMREKRLRVPGEKRRKKVDPLDELFSSISDPDQIADRLVELAKLGGRGRDDWWWDEVSQASLAELKAKLEAVNHGRCEDAMLPHRITIVVPTPLPGLSYDLELVDSRGLDGALAGRPDLQLLLRDERTILVICAPFKKAPGEEVRNLLKAIEEDAEAPATEHRVLLTLMDQGHAAGVNGAEGDREEGQAIKVDECLADLESKGIKQCANEDLIVAFDTFLDPIEQLAGAVQERIAATRRFMLEWLQTHVEDAESFLERLESKFAQSARAEVDRRLRELVTRIEREREGIPLENPIAGLLAATNTRHPSQVFASCRRNGYYGGMDAYGAIRSGAASALTQWLNTGHRQMLQLLDELEEDPRLQQASDHIRLRRELYERAHAEAIRDYASAVREEIETLLANDDAAWKKCTEEWGAGSGFRDRVIEHHEEWSEVHSDLHAHREVPELDLELGHESTS